MRFGTVSNSGITILHSLYRRTGIWEIPGPLLSEEHIRRGIGYTARIESVAVDIFHFHRVAVVHVSTILASFACCRRHFFGPTVDSLAGACTTFAFCAIIYIYIYARVKSRRHRVLIITNHTMPDSVC